MNNGKDSLHFKENNLISKNNKHNKVNRTGRESTKWHSKIASGNSGSSRRTGGSSGRSTSSKSSGNSGIVDTTPVQEKQVNNDAVFDLLESIVSKNKSLIYAEKDIMSNKNLTAEEKQLALEQIREYYRSK